MVKRTEVERFAEAMEKKLQQKDPKHGATGWKTIHAEYLLNRMQSKFCELDQALKHGKSDDVLRQAVNVANFSMMIADVRGGLMKPVKPNDMEVEDCKKKTVVIDGHNFYLTVCDKSVSCTIPRENSSDNHKLRVIIDSLCHEITMLLGGDDR